MSSKVRELLFGITIAAAGLAAAHATSKDTRYETPQVQERILDNGLKVLVKPDRRAPVVVSQVWYKVGGSYEPKGLTGVSHALEHMMFKGTNDLGPNEFSKIIASYGGRENAFTGRDYTAYFQTLEKSKLEIAFKLEADRMRNLKLSPSEFEKEIKVVKEERRLRTEDRPEALVYEKFMAAAYTKANYRNPIVGWSEDLDSMGVQDLRSWYDNFYVPNNATLVVVGDVEPEAVFRLARRYFGPLPRGKVTLPPNPVEPPQTTERRIEVTNHAKVPYLVLGYHVPVIATAESEWEPYALEVAAYLLDGGMSSRLPAELVRGQQVAASVNVSYDSAARDPTLFVIDANPAPGVTLGDLEKSIERQIDRMRTELATEPELDRIKAQLVAGKVYEADSSFYQAMRLGVFETTGLDWQLSQSMNEKLRAVTAEQVRDVVRKYLVEDNLTVADLRPQTDNEG